MEIFIDLSNVALGSSTLAKSACRHGRDIDQSMYRIQSNLCSVDVRKYVIVLLIMWPGYIYRLL